MTIYRLMELHDQFAAQGLPESFGDGYLMNHNQIYNKVRTEALKNSYLFSKENDVYYDTFPLLQLEYLLSKKTFYYSNNILALKSLSPVQLSALEWEDIDGNLKRNFVFHESCHGIVREFACKHLEALAPPTDTASQRRFSLRMLLEESFANTCELLGGMYAVDAAHRVFYEMNSYICEFESRTYLKRAKDDIGTEKLGVFFVLSYLHSNFLRERIQEFDLQEILQMCQLPNMSLASVKNLRALSKIVFNLSERFRYQTTRFHLRLAGIDTPFEELVDYNFMSSLAREPGWEAFLIELLGFFQA